ncbi:glycosyltransferase family 2 protein [Cognatiyoonia sp. IB215182]|uniref:glycosyltransferase family 2 protein n=1 Tax=Cognatiyoonia sp. IB215182 TaxID=3097353 RepID=UPI002A16E43D|nr:glycosyltransferase family 2 protein [Cognatiyoonia sp. IB215182]MDX8353324.1 glycosyltransferase family 2 protein [Cognatiyoonia sp. IB215182]
MTDPEISVVAPAYNEEASVNAFYERVVAVFDEHDIRGEIIFVNDGSTDGTLDALVALHAQDSRVVIVDLSRNFGKEIALTAGLDHVRGQAAVPIDVDLQDPPELIPKLMAAWREGYIVVNARRRSRQGETYLKKATASAFYKLMQKFDRHAAIPENVGDYRLIDRKALDAVTSMRERHRFMKGIFHLVGFKQTFVDYDRDPRFGGTSSFNYWKLWNFSLEGITSFTTLPLRLFGYVGFVVALMSFAYGMFILTKALFFDDPVAGFPTLFVSIAFLGGIQLIGLGVIGEYLGRIFNETKNRPLYFVNTVYEASSTQTLVSVPQSENSAS